MRRRRRDRHCQWRHDDIFDISSLKVTARVVFPAKRTRVPTDSEAPNADECDGDQIEERSGNWNRLFNVVFQPLVPAFYRFQTGRVPTIVHSTHGPAPFCRISCARPPHVMSFVSVMRSSVHPWAILLCKLQNYNSALRELSRRSGGRRPLTKVSLSLFASTLLSQELDEEQRCVDRHSAALRRWRPRRAAFSLLGLSNGFSFRQFPQCRSSSTRVKVTLDSSTPLKRETYHPLPAYA